MKSFQQFLPLPRPLLRVLMDEVRLNVDRYWDSISNLQMMNYVVDYVVNDGPEVGLGQTSRVVRLIVFVYHVLDS